MADILVRNRNGSVLLKTVARLISSAAFFAVSIGGAVAADYTLGNYAPGHYPVGDYMGTPTTAPGPNDDHAGQTEVNNGTSNTFHGSYATIQNGVPNWTQETLQQIADDGRVLNGAVLPAGVLTTGEQNQTVTYFDETNQESVTVNVYNSSNLAP